MVGTLTGTVLDVYHYIRLYPGLTSETVESLAPRDRYNLLWAYYDSNELYQQVQAALRQSDRWMESMRPLRNPVSRSVEYHVAHLWPGALPKALPIAGKDKEFTAAIEKVWEWSNWGTKKQLAARWFALFGDMYIKVVTASDDDDQVERVYFQLIDPRHVHDDDVQVDERGYVTRIRVDIPKQSTDDDATTDYTHTEVWDKETLSYRVWKHDKGIDAELSDLGDPDEEAHMLDDYGIDFVPFVHAPFIDVGGKRGQALVWSSVLDIDEVNRQTTRLHQMLFRYNKPLFSLVSGAPSKDGRPLPPPRIKGGTEGSSTDSGDTISIGDDRLYRLPSTWSLESMVPDVDYAAALSIVNAQIDEIEKNLPELTYQDLMKAGEISGKAARMKLAAAIARVEEARGNAETAFVRANMMALTLAQIADLEGFGADEIGTYDDGGFTHSFTEREVMPISDDEKGATLGQMTSQGIPMIIAMRLLNYSTEQIIEAEAELAAQRMQAERDRAQMTLQALRDVQGQGDQPAPAATTASTEGDAPENIEATEGLNGAQIKSALEILEGVRTGTTAREVAIELLLALGLQRERVEKMVSATITQDEPEDEVVTT